MLVQISVPFLLAGLGTVFAGLLLEVVQVRKERNVDRFRGMRHTGCGDINTSKFLPREKAHCLLLPSVFLLQSWDVFQEIAALLILVPALLGMKGNLEMTLASRLSTAVSLISPP